MIATAPALVRHALSGPAMGSRWSATFYAPAGFDAEPLRLALAAAVEAVEQDMSSWRPTSHLSRLNAAPVGDWVPLPANLLTVIEAGLEIGRQTGGGFNIGVGDLVKAWGFGFGARTPDVEGISGLRARVPVDPPQTLQLDVTTGRARKFAEITVDLGGIAKGFGVDELARVMGEAGIAAWLVGIDGEMRGEGIKPDGRPWAVGHERPDRDARALMGVLEISGAAVATSGNYRHVVEANGRILSHTMDGRQGRPLDNDLASVTVLAPTAMVADAWATALMVLGREAGLALARQAGISTILVGADGSVASTLP
jgi:thiamine biosynthesis lipoprotein